MKMLICPNGHSFKVEDFESLECCTECGNVSYYKPDVFIDNSVDGNIRNNLVDRIENLENRIIMKEIFNGVLFCLIAAIFMIMGYRGLL